MEIIVFLVILAACIYFGVVIGLKSGNASSKSQINTYVVRNNIHSKDELIKTMETQKFPKYAINQYCKMYDKFVK